MYSLKQRNMKVFVSLVIILFQLVVAFSFGVGLVGASSRTLTVPDQYPSIMSAVNAASAGDTISVKSGIYYENVLISKPISIIGENSENTIVIGQGGSANTYVFNVTTGNVEVSGFTIESVNYSASTPSLFAGGIAIGGDNCIVTGNNILNVYRGIYVGSGWDNLVGAVSQTAITNNNITGALSGGIRVNGGSDNKISNNNLVQNNGSAIMLGRGLKHCLK